MSIASYPPKSHTEPRATERPGVSGREIPDVGVALFDDPQAPAGGWSCIANETPSRFSSFADLRNNAIWVSNLDYTAYQAFGRPYSNLRRADFFRHSLLNIAADLGFNIGGAHAREGAAKLAGIASRVITLGAHCYGVGSMSAVLRTNNFYEDLRQVLPRAPNVAPEMVQPIESAYQSSSSPSGGGFEPDSIFLTMRRNRFHHAQQVMDTLVPDEGWQLRSSSSETSMNFWLDERVACLVEATVELSSVAPDVADVIAFGAVPGAGRKGMIRSYMTQPELRWLCQHAKVHITRGYLCGSRPVPEAARLPGALIADPLFGLSYSAGLLAEMHWSAYACQPWSRAGANGQSGKSTSSWAAWFRANDRAISFHMALECRKAGFSVMNYGNGAVRVRVRRDRIYEAAELAQRIGAAHPSMASVIRECVPRAH